MKLLSASIIVLAAAVLVTGGGFIAHDGAIFVQGVGVLLGLIGLGGWFVAWGGEK